MRRIKAGTVDVSVVIKIIDSTDGTPETGVVFNTVGIDLEYRRDGAASVDITEVTQTIAGAHADGGFVAVGNGYYRLDLPDAACAAGVAGVLIHGTVTGMIVIGEYIELEVNTAADVFSRLGTPAGASIAADIAVIAGQTDDIGVAGAGLTALATQASVNALPTAAANADAVWDEAQSGHVTAGSFGELATEIAAILVDTGTDIPALINALNDLDAAGIRAAIGLAAANFDTQLADLPTVAEFNARTLLAAAYFDPVTDTVSLATGGITATTIASDAIDAAALATDAVTEIVNGILAGTITELAALPAASPTLAQALALVYMAIRNRRDTTATSDEIHNDAGVALFSATLSDDLVTFSKTEYV